MRLDRESEHWYRVHKGLAGWKKECVRDHPYSVTFVGAIRRNTTTVLRLEVTAELIFFCQMNALPDGSWKTPPVSQVSAVCLRNTPNRVTKISISALWLIYFSD